MLGPARPPHLSRYEGREAVIQFIDNPDVEPTCDPETGVPFCSTDECKSYDGKRCKVLGLRPGSICEPAVIDVMAALRKLVAAERASTSPGTQPATSKGTCAAKCNDCDDEYCVRAPHDDKSHHCANHGGTCGQCGGSRWVSAGVSTCPSCKHHRKDVASAAPSGDAPAKCEACSGRGRYINPTANVILEPADWITCSLCGGTGSVRP
jgi:hypothetical protein